MLSCFAIQHPPPKGERGPEQVSGAHHVPVLCGGRGQGLGPTDNSLWHLHSASPSPGLAPSPPCCPQPWHSLRGWWGCLGGGGGGGGREEHFRVCIGSVRELLWVTRGKKRAHTSPVHVLLEKERGKTSSTLRCSSLHWCGRRRALTCSCSDAG